ncbi:LuxR C-terminal-related transcriptional regulator [Lentzea sp. NPDC102401]|uniref:helix-turn-helix transcriptional regulator n=1 Tax=Lentzea sp. NPDC102401 TaxID=3364128 RepID=UPI00381EEB3F
MTRRDRALGRAGVDELRDRRGGQPPGRPDHLLGRPAVQRVAEAALEADVDRQHLGPLHERGLLRRVAGPAPRRRRRSRASPPVARRSTRRWWAGCSAGPPPGHSPRAKREVLGLMAEGCANVAIARRLWLTERTVETHIGSIMAKLGPAADVEEHRRVPAVLTCLAEFG